MEATSREMKYRSYPQFVDYLFSEEGKTNTYDDLHAYLTTSGSFSDFEPTDDFPGVSLESVSGRFVSDSKFTYPSSRMDARPWVCDSNGLYNETDKTYEEVFNVPAKTNLSKSTYIDAFVKKALYNAELNDQSSQSSDPAEALSGYLPFKTSFDETEYDMYHVPLTFLNGDSPGVRADTITYSGSSLSVADGCLIGVQKQHDGVETIYPIGFIDFEGVMPCTRYDVKFDPQGFYQLT